MTRPDPDYREHEAEKGPAWGLTWAKGYPIGRGGQAGLAPASLGDPASAVRNGCIGGLHLDAVDAFYPLP